MRVVVMGVTGSGKSTVGAALAGRLTVPFADADDFHSGANVEKMAAGIPLDDEDRWPWLEAVGRWLLDHADAVMACSALKRTHRDAIRRVAGDVVFVHLAGRQSVLAERVARRTATQGHFAGVELVASQFRALEPLGFHEVGATIDVSDLQSAEVAREVEDLIALFET